VNRRPFVVVPLVAATLTLLTASAGCDTRSCTYVHGTQSDAPCDVDDVVGTVVTKTTASPGSNNPSLVVETRVGDVRVFLKREYWNRYVVGGDYP
jgi:hypothetical protein